MCCALLRTVHTESQYRATTGMHTQYKLKVQLRHRSTPSEYLGLYSDTVHSYIVRTALEIILQGMARASVGVLSVPGRSVWIQMTTVPPDPPSPPRP